MKNILILAYGDMAKHFVQWVGKSRIDNNHYYITCKNYRESLSQNGVNLSFIEDDPTSYLKLKNIMSNIDFATVFIVMSNKDEALYSYKNIRIIQPKIRVIFVSKWDELKLNDENTKVININELIASSLYEELPNVPVIAKNIGLVQGEIMEVLVSFGSSYAYRHIGSISNIKWRIVAIYRDNKQLFPNNATMIKPNDRLIIIGNPIVLEEVYKRITKRKGLFPEPFGKNLYLIIDITKSKEDILIWVNEAVFLSHKFLKSKLYIRVIGDIKSDILNELKKFETEYIEILIKKGKQEIIDEINYETTQYDIGLFLIDRTLFDNSFKNILFLEKRPIYLFGEQSLYNISRAIILMGEENDMESLSSSVFDLSETLGLKLSLSNYDPEGDFLDKKNIIEHYESLSKIYGLKIDINEKKINPIRELREESEILHIIPFKKNILKKPFLNFFSRDFSRYFLSIKKHPQLLIPIED
jgi:hypothetical protein